MHFGTILPIPGLQEITGPKLEYFIKFLCVPYLERPTYPWCSMTTDNDYAWLKLQSKFNQKSISKAKRTLGNMILPIKN